MELFKTTNIPSILNPDFALLAPSLAIILLGELLIFYGDLTTGVIFHAINLNALILLIISLRNDERSLLEKKISSTSEEFKLETCQVGEDKKLRKQLIQSIILLLQLRILNVSMPIFFTITMYWYPLIYSPMFISIYLMIKNQNISPRSLGFTTDRLHIYIIPAVLLGFIIAFVEYQIIGPSYLLRSPSIPNIIVLAIIMFVFVGLIEELIFRSLLQTRFEEAIGTWEGILISSFFFGIMHSGYGVLNEITFTMVVGFILGLLFHKTRSLPLIVIIHGTVNVVLFGLLPYYT